MQIRKENKQMDNKLNLELFCCGYLVTDWKQGKTHYVNTIAVHTTKEKTEFISLICKEDKIKGKKGELIEVSGSPMIKVYNDKGSYTIFVSKIYEVKK